MFHFSPLRHFIHILCKAATEAEAGLIRLPFLSHLFATCPSFLFALKVTAWSLYPRLQLAGSWRGRAMAKPGTFCGCRSVAKKGVGCPLCPSPSTSVSFPVACYNLLLWIQNALATSGESRRIHGWTRRAATLLSAPQGMFRLDGHCEAGAPGELCRFKEMSGHWAQTSAWGRWLHAPTAWPCTQAGLGEEVLCAFRAGILAAWGSLRSLCPWKQHEQGAAVLSSMPSPSAFMMWLFSEPQLFCQTPWQEETNPTPWQLLTQTLLLRLAGSSR